MEAPPNKPPTPRQDSSNNLGDSSTSNAEAWKNTIELIESYVREEVQNSRKLEEQVATLKEKVRGLKRERTDWLLKSRSFSLDQSSIELPSRAANGASLNSSSASVSELEGNGMGKIEQDTSSRLDTDEDSEEVKQEETEKEIESGSKIAEDQEQKKTKGRKKKSSEDKKEEEQQSEQKEDSGQEKDKESKKKKKDKKDNDLQLSKGKRKLKSSKKGSFANASSPSSERPGEGSQISADGEKHQEKENKGRERKKTAENSGEKEQEKEQVKEQKKEKVKAMKKGSKEKEEKGKKEMVLSLDLELKGSGIRSPLKKSSSFSSSFDNLEGFLPPRADTSSPKRERTKTWGKKKLESLHLNGICSLSKCIFSFTHSFFYYFLDTNEPPLSTRVIPFARSEGIPTPETRAKDIFSQFVESERVYTHNLKALLEVSILFCFHFVCLFNCLLNYINSTLKKKQIFVEPLRNPTDEPLIIIDEDLDTCFSRLDRLRVLHDEIYSKACSADESFSFLLSFLPHLKKVYIFLELSIRDF